MQGRAENILPYNFNRFIRHSGDFNFSVKMGIVNHSYASLMGTNMPS